MTLADMAAVWNSPEWAEQYDAAGEHSNDYAMRGEYTVQRIAARNRTRGILAECGGCGRVLDSGKRSDVRHANRCADENRPYAYTGK